MNQEKKVRKDKEVNNINGTKNEVEDEAVNAVETVSAETSTTNNQPSIKKNTVLNFIKTLSSIIFPLITFPYVSRVLQPENIGKYNFGNTYVNYFSLIASLGITTYAIRECSRVRDDKKKLSETASQIFSINVFTTIIAYILLFAILFLYPRMNPYIRLIIIQSVIIVFTTLGADWINSAMEDFKYITIRTVAFQFISLGLMFIFVRKPDDYIKYAAIGALSSSGGNIVNIFYRRKFCRIRFTTKTDWRRHLKPILLLFVMLVAQTIFSNSDITMLGLMRGDYETGLYSTCAKVYNIINQLMASVLWVMMPRLSNYFAEENYKGINELLRKNLELQVIIGLPCIFGISVLSQEVLRIIGGASYVSAWPYLIILMIALFFSLIGGSFLGNNIMLPSKKEKYFVVACIVAAIVNIVLNFVLIPFMGPTGAALTTLLAHIIILVMLYPHVDKRINIGNVKKIFVAPTIGSIIILLWCLLIKCFFNNYLLILLFGILGSVVLYYVVLYMMKYELFMELYQSAMSKVRKSK